jgi:hypothetical protein
MRCANRDIGLAIRSPLAARSTPDAGALLYARWQRDYHLLPAHFRDMSSCGRNVPSLCRRLANHATE